MRRPAAGNQAWRAGAIQWMMDIREGVGFLVGKPTPSKTITEIARLVARVDRLSLSPQQLRLLSSFLALAKCSSAHANKTG